MKRWLFLLALPWAVQVSTEPPPRYCGDYQIVDPDGRSHSGCEGYPRRRVDLYYEGKQVISCYDEESCADMVEAFNTATLSRAYKKAAGGTPRKFGTDCWEGEACK